MTQQDTPRRRRKCAIRPGFRSGFPPLPPRRLTPERQVAFIRALAECGCVREACRRVGMSPESAYGSPAAPTRRASASPGTSRWTMRSAGSATRPSAAASTASPSPIIYQGELVGEHRRYDERLTMFILRYRDPARYGKHLDRSSPAAIPRRRRSTSPTRSPGSSRTRGAKRPACRAGCKASSPPTMTTRAPRPARRGTGRTSIAGRPGRPHAGAELDDSSEDDEPGPDETGRRQSLRT